MKTKIFTLLIALIGCAGIIFAWDYKQVQIGDLYYNLDATNQTAEVTYQVKSYENYSGLTSTIIPSSVTYNEEEYSVTSIGKYSFNKCKGLTSVTIPNSATSIGDYAFYNCKGLTFVTIPNSATSIGDYAFYNCTNLTSIDIPNSVTSIGDDAFDGCSGLTSVEIPNSVTSIGNNAFSSCRGLTYVEIPNSVTSIGNNAFSSCRGLTSIDVVTDNPNYCSIDGVLFNKDKTVILQYPPKKEGTSYDIPISVTSISSGAFAYSSLTSVTIPNSVTSIGTASFAYSGLTSVTIPNSIKCIEDQVFEHNDHLTSIEIPNSVTSIGTFSFAYSGLTSVTIPNSVTNIGDGAFYECYDLTSISVALDNPNYSSIDGVLFNKDKTVILQYPPKKEGTSFNIPNSVTSIGDRAFYNCNELTSVTISDNVTSIGDLAFYDCYDLTSIEIPNSVTSIGNNAFSSCRGLTYVEIPNSVTSIGDWAFSYCSGLTSIKCQTTTLPVLGESVFIGVYKNVPLFVPSESLGLFREAEQWSDFTNIFPIRENAEDPCFIASGICGLLGDNLTWELSCDNVLTISGIGGMKDFESPWNEYCNIINSIIIDEGITSIGKQAFYLCDHFTSIEIPNSVTSIEAQAFWFCTGLSSVSIPNSVTSIADYAFYACYGLTSLDVASDNPNYSSIDGVLFNKDKTVILQYPLHKVGTSYNIPNSVTNIGEWAFSDCSGLTSVEIPNSVTSIGEQAFRNCRGLTSIEIPNGVTSIGNAAFYSCTGLTSVTIPNSVTSIVMQAFEDCTALASVTIPNNVTSIGYQAFSGCMGLTSISCNSENPPTLDYNVFNGVDKSISLYVPSKSIGLYREADQWKDFTNILPIEEEWNPDEPVNPGNYELRLFVNDETMGSVTGDGLYAQETEVTITAIPAEGCRFVRWSDGNTNAERSITLMVDTTFTAYFEPISITLNIKAATEQITGRWFAFGVPFDVAVSTGIFIVGTDDPAMCNYDFVIDEYDGALRASTQNGWKRVAANDTLRPGRFYMIAPKTAREWRFEAANPGEFSEENSVSVNAYPSPYGERHSGWNGIANPQWAATTAEMDGVTYATVYNNYYGVYSTELLCEKEWSRAEPFFVQTPNDDEVVFYAENIPSPSAAPMRMEFTSDKNVSYTLELSDVSFNYTDKAYISTAESKEDRYMIGHDLEKMQVNNAVVPQLWLEAYGTRLAAYEVPIVKEETYIPIGLYAPQEGTYALTVNDVPEVASIYLTKDGQPIWNVSDGTYALTLENGDNEGYGLSVNYRKIPTGIGNTDISENVRKMVINGQILILRGDKTYTITGQEMK